MLCCVFSESFVLKRVFLFQTQNPITPHCIVTLPNSNGMQLLLCYDNEGVYVNTYGRTSKNMLLQVKRFYFLVISLLNRIRPLYKNTLNLIIYMYVCSTGVDP